MSLSLSVYAFVRITKRADIALIIQAVKLTATLGPTAITLDGINSAYAKVNIALIKAIPAKKNTVCFLLVLYLV